MATKRKYNSSKDVEREIHLRSREDFLNGINRLYKVTGTIFIKEIFEDVLDEFSRNKLNKQQ